MIRHKRTEPAVEATDTGNSQDRYRLLFERSPDAVIVTTTDGRILDLGYGRHVLVGVHHVVQEAGGQFNSFPELVPVHAAVCCGVLGQVYRAQAAVLIRT